MSTLRNHDAMFAAWLDEGPTDIPTHVLDAALEEARSMPQLRDWLGPLRRWIPMDATLSTQTRTGRSPIGVLALIALLIVALAAAALIVGGRHRLPPPSGLARNGLIAFDAEGDLFVAQADGSGRRALESGPAVDTSPIWSPDGTRIAFWSQPEEAALRDLVVIDADGSGRRVIASATGLGDSLGAVATVAWAPDSAQLAFSDVDKRLHVARADGSSDRTIGGDQLLRDEPAWSPDGRLIAFRGTARDGSDGLYVITPDGSTERRLSTSAGSGFAFAGSQWSPDATRLAYYDGVDGAHDVAVVDVTRDRETILSSSPLDEYWPTWSADGAWVLYQRNEASLSGPGNVEIRVNSDGTGETVVASAFAQLNGQALGGSPMYVSPDGALAFGYGGDGDQGKIVVLRTDGTGSPMLIDAPGNLGNGSWQRLAP